MDTYSLAPLSIPLPPAPNLPMLVNQEMLPWIPGSSRASHPHLWCLQLPATFHLPALYPPQLWLQDPSSITEVNLLFKGVVCGVSKLSSSRIHLSNVALAWGLVEAPLFIYFLSRLIHARHGFSCLHLRQVIRQSWKDWEGEKGGTGSFKISALRGCLDLGKGAHHDLTLSLVCGCSVDTLWAL